ncbi:MAG: LysR family transcriptional regulator [Burkholderiaceae bacterium]
MKISPHDSALDVLPVAGALLPRDLLGWTDFQLVLEVARKGSVAKACSALGATHSTVLRKLDAIERRLKTRLFERGHGRYALTPAGHEIEQAASSFEPLARLAETRVRGQDMRPSGDVRVAVASILLEQLLPGVLVQFRSAFPDVRIELVASRDHVSLSRRDADVAIRVADHVPEWMIGRKLANLQFKVYGLRRSGGRSRLRSIEELTQERRWIAFERDARELKFDRWLQVQVPDSSVVMRVDNFSHALRMVQAGLGIAVLPAFLEESVPQLLPLTEAIAPLETPLWLLTHPELKNTMRIKVLLRAFGPALAHAVQAAQDLRPAD